MNASTVTRRATRSSRPWSRSASAAARHEPRPVVYRNFESAAAKPVQNPAAYWRKIAALQDQFLNSSSLDATRARLRDETRQTSDARNSNGSESSESRGGGGSSGDDDGGGGDDDPPSLWTFVLIPFPILESSLDQRPGLSKPWRDRSGDFKYDVLVGVTVSAIAGAGGLLGVLIWRLISSYQ